MVGAVVEHTSMVGDSCYANPSFFGCLDGLQLLVWKLHRLDFLFNFPVEDLSIFSIVPSKFMSSVWRFLVENYLQISHSLQDG